MGSGGWVGDFRLVFFPPLTIGGFCGRKEFPGTDYVWGPEGILFPATGGFRLGFLRWGLTVENYRSLLRELRYWWDMVGMTFLPDIPLMKRVKY